MLSEPPMNDWTFDLNSLVNDKRHQIIFLPISIPSKDGVSDNTRTINFQEWFFQKKWRKWDKVELNFALTSFRSTIDGTCWRA